MKTATFIKEWHGVAHQKLYRLSEPLVHKDYWDSCPLGSYDYVVVSAVNAMFTGPETYIFGANEHGEVLHWGELPGSYRGGLNHNKALEDAGYKVEGGGMKEWYD